MKRFLLAMTAASALCASVPANAQLGDIVSGIFGGGGGNYDSRIRQLESRIQNGVQRGTISRGEADRLWDWLQDIKARESQYDDNGYTGDERNDLDRRIADLERRIADAGRGGDSWGGGGNDYDGQFDGQLRDLRDRIEQGVRSGQLSGTEAQRLRAQLFEINRLEQRYDNDGISRAERDDLRNRIERLRRALQNALRDGDYRGGDRWDDRNCPPGLAKKNNGCLPPGQVGRDRDRYDDRRDRDDDDDRRDRRRDRDDD